MRDVVAQALLMGLVEGTRHGSDDAQDLVGWHSVRNV